MGTTKNIVFQLCLTDQLFALAFQLLKIIDLLPIHISPYLAQPCPAVVLQIIFARSFHYFKPVSCWILFCENVAGVPRPFDQLPSRVGKLNTFKTPEMRLYFDSDV